MRFRLLGIPVEVQLGFWLSVVLFQRHLLPGGDYTRLLLWAAVAFAAVMIHELGHVAAIRRHRLAPKITLYWLGGSTTFRAPLPLGRIDRLVIDLMGPLASLTAAGAVYGTMHALIRFVPGFLGALPELAVYALNRFMFASLYWGLFTLLPVLPLSGGQALEHALGPGRARAAARISFVTGALGAAYFATGGHLIPALLLALAGLQNLLRSFAEPDMPRPRNPDQDAFMPGEIQAQLSLARAALRDDNPGDAVAIARALLARTPAPPPRALGEAHEIIAWAAARDSDRAAAAGALARARRYGEPDPALVAEIHLLEGRRGRARDALLAAQAAGDIRKEVIGPLIRLLLDDGEIGRAAALAIAIVDALSEEDARRMAEIALSHGAFDEAATLYEEMFRRTGEAEDAYGAARAAARGGDLERSIALLRRAVEAGFSDLARARSDAALEALRGGPLEQVLQGP